MLERIRAGGCRPLPAAAPAAPAAAIVCAVPTCLPPDVSFATVAGCNSRPRARHRQHEGYGQPPAAAVPCAAVGQRVTHEASCLWGEEAGLPCTAARHATPQKTALPHRPPTPPAAGSCPPSSPTPPHPSADPRASKQFLLLAHLYAKTDARSLDFLSSKLLPARYSAVQLGVAAGVATALVGGAFGGRGGGGSRCALHGGAAGCDEGWEEEHTKHLPATPAPPSAHPLGAPPDPIQTAPPPLCRHVQRRSQPRGGARAVGAHRGGDRRAGALCPLHHRPPAGEAPGWQAGVVRCSPAGCPPCSGLPTACEPRCSASRGTLLFVARLPACLPTPCPRLA